MSISHRLDVRGLLNSYHWAKILGRFFSQNRITSSLGQTEGLHQNEVDWLNTFWLCC